LAARRQFRQPRTLDEAFTFTQSFAWKGGRLLATQARDEIVWLLAIVNTLAPRRVLEIGTANGGTLFLWAQVAAPDAHLVSVDMSPMGLLGRHAAFAVLCRGFARASQRIDLVYGVNSSTRARSRPSRASSAATPLISCSTTAIIPRRDQPRFRALFDTRSARRLDRISRR
jgi:hypothetical protein